MLKNYFGQLQENYPDKVEVLEWMKYALDSKMYYFGQHFKAPYEGDTLKNKVKTRLATLRQVFSKSDLSYQGAVITNAYFNVASYIKKEGYNVLLPPWQTGCLTKKSQETLYLMMNADFNFVISDGFVKHIYGLRDELREFFKTNSTPFLLLSNDMVPVHRIAIDVCKELGIPTGIFLHGLPGRYNAIDDSRANNLFVWGEKIKDNYINAGSKTNIVVTGHPNFSSFIISEQQPEYVLVLSRAINGAPSSSDQHHIDERGVCIQHIYAVEAALKKAGINKAVLRLHPSENPEWYSKFMDKEFYTLDTNALSYSIGHSIMVVGSISTVMIDTVLNGIPCYPYVIDKDSNNYVGEIAPPFCNKPEFPTAFTIDELAENITKGNSVTSSHFDGYINPTFDVQKIIQYINKID